MKDARSLANDGPDPSPELILAENVRVHAAESSIYDRVHGEIFNRYEQSLLERDLDALCEDGPADALDLGAGTGNITLKLARRGLRVTALDLSPEMLEVLDRRAKAQGLTVRAICTDVDGFLSTHGTLPALVTMSSFLHQLPRPWETLARIAKAVPPGGRVYITHEPTGRRTRPPIRLVNLLDRALWNLRHPRLTSRARAIDYSISDHHAKAGLDASRLAEVLTQAGLKVEFVRLYTAARSSLLSRLASRLGGDAQATLMAHRTRS